MQDSKFILIITLFFMTNSCTMQTKNDNSITYLENEHIKIGLLIDVGGRMVFFGSPDGENMLLSDSKLWDENSQDRITPNKDADFKAYNGFITWVGPQTEWWKQQEINPEKKANKSVWPPDPWLLYGSYSIVKETKHSISIVGEESPITGLKLTKTFKLDDTTLLINVTAQNMRTTAVAWDLWSNARFDAYTPFFVPDVNTTSFKVENPEGEKVELMKYKIKDQDFSFITEEPNKGINQRFLKTFIHSQKADMVALSQGNMVVIDFDSLDPESIHPDQALIEIYNRTSSVNSDDNILELEHHGAYTNLEPNESMELNEKWHLVKMHENASIEDCKVAYYNRK